MGRKNKVDWNAAVDLIRRLVDGKGKLSVHEVSQHLKIHPNLAMQILSYIAKTFPQDYYYSDLTLTKRRK